MSDKATAGQSIKEMIANTQSKIDREAAVEIRNKALDAALRVPFMSTTLGYQHPVYYKQAKDIVDDAKIFERYLKTGEA